MRSEDNNTLIKMSELVNDKGVLIIQYSSPPEKKLASMIYKPILQLQTPHALPSDQAMF